MGDFENKIKEYWENRSLTHGHTGDANKLLYRYDQAFRIWSVKKALLRLKKKFGSPSSVLDVGCGSGDFINIFAGDEKVEVVGIDLSHAIVEKVRNRFSANKNVKIVESSIESASLSNAGFDIVLAFNVLQHIVEDNSFAEAVSAIANCTNDSGIILTIDFMDKEQYSPNMFFKVRTIQEYTNNFKKHGAFLLEEIPMPRYGIRACNSFARRLRKLLPGQNRGQNKTAETSPAPTSRSGRMAGAERLAHYALAAAILLVFSPIDLYALFFGARSSDLKILVYCKQP